MAQRFPGRSIEGTVDIRALIAAVERQPLIWDKREELYKCRSSTAQAWDEVAKELDPTIDDEDPKQKAMWCAVLTRKWKNLRDTWRKVQKKRILQAAEDAETEDVGRTYMYQEQMQFLEEVEFPSIMAKVNLKNENPSRPVEKPAASPTSVSSDVEESPSIGEGSTSRCVNPQVVSGTIPLSLNSKKRIRILSFPDTTTANNETGAPFEKKSKVVSNISEVPEIKEVENRHVSFFRSLIPSVKQLEEEQILEFQVGVLNLLRTVRKRKGPSPLLSSTSTFTDSGPSEG